MPDRTEREKLVAEALAAIEKAMDMVDALCRPRGSMGSREWLMSIPARPDYDPDLVISDALGKAKKVLAAADLLSEVEPDGWASCIDPEQGLYFVTTRKPRSPETHFTIPVRFRPGPVQEAPDER